MARTNARVTKLEWDIERGIIECSILSYKAQKIKISSPVCKGSFRTSKGDICHNGDEMEFGADEEITFYF